MTDQRDSSLDRSLECTQFDIGKPVEWMVDPHRPGIILGVTYVFGQSGNRKTVWYTSNKRRAKSFLAVNAPPES
jgi:hypothetical protein